MLVIDVIDYLSITKKMIELSSSLNFNLINNFFFKV